MNTPSMRLRYRPLRPGWCVQADDLSGFRAAVAQSFALWGGCYSPIIPIDDAAHAEDLVRLYRVDTFIAFAKLTEFTPDEIALASAVNTSIVGVLFS